MRRMRVDSAGDLRGEDGVGACRVLCNATAARRCHAFLDTSPWQGTLQHILGNAKPFTGFDQ